MLSEKSDFDPKKYPELALIKAVERRRALWDPTAHFYRNTSAVKILWSEVAVESGLTELQVKTRWKTLRDYYRIELKKLKSGKALGRRNNWPFFNAMSFLEEMMNSNRSQRDESNVSGKCDTNEGNQTHEPSANLPNQTISISSSPRNQNVSGEAQSSTNETKGDKKCIVDPCKKPALCPCTSCRWAPYPSRLIRNQEGVRQELDSVEKKWLRQIEAKRLEILERSVRLEDDEDLLFFRSLLSSVRSLSKTKKMRLRLQFQEILCKEMESGND